MNGLKFLAIAGAMTLAVAPWEATLAVAIGNGSIASAPQKPYLQCVPYARRVSGIPIYGDAHTWWKQAEGRFERGTRPKVGAVMSFRPHGSMKLGHVAAVSRIVDSRTVLLRHSNWSPINGRRGQIEDDVRAIDVSENNDWSKVRVWYAPIQDLGGTHWPLNGFIYNEKPGKRGKAEKASLAGSEGKAGSESKSGKDAKPGLAKPGAAKPGPAKRVPPALANDPIGRIIAGY